MTVEEKAKEYADGIVPIMVPGSEIELTIDDMNEFAQKDYLAGYNEAMRWRNPKDELPETGKSVLVKYRTAKNVEKHGIGRYFYLGIGNPWIIEGSTSREVIGWRPIE